MFFLAQSKIHESAHPFCVADCAADICSPVPRFEDRAARMCALSRKVLNRPPLATDYEAVPLCVSTRRFLHITRASSNAAECSFAISTDLDRLRREWALWCE